MQEIRSFTLPRDCPAVGIPAGTNATLAAGTVVDVTQTLGGSVTVRAPGGLYRIDAREAGALGLVEPGEARTGQPDAAPTTREAMEQSIWSALKSCFDPEIPVNIVDLGLVYDLSLQPVPDGGYHVGVKMTLTAPGCGMGRVIAGDAQERILNLPGVAAAEVEIVWDPPWHQSMITAEGRRILGLD